MGVATAEHAGHGLLDFDVCGFWFAIQKCLGSHDDAIDAKSALHRLLIDERLLNRVRLLEASEAFERRDLRSRDSAHRRDAGTYCLAFDDHRAGSALTETATELRPAQRKIVAQHVEQRCGRVHVYGVGPPAID